MKLAVELEFSDERAAQALQWLQSLPSGIAARLRGKGSRLAEESAAARESDEELSEAAQKALLYKVFGGWQSEAGGEEMVRQIYEDRRDEPREVNL